MRKPLHPVDLIGVVAIVALLVVAAIVWPSGTRKAAVAKQTMAAWEQEFRAGTRTAVPTHEEWERIRIEGYQSSRLNNYYRGLVEAHKLQVLLADDTLQPYAAALPVSKASWQVRGSEVELPYEGEAARLRANAILLKGMWEDLQKNPNDPSIRAEMKKRGDEITLHLSRHQVTRVANRDVDLQTESASVPKAAVEMLPGAGGPMNALQSHHLFPLLKAIGEAHLAIN